MNLSSNVSLRALKQRLDHDLTLWEAELFPPTSDEEIDREMRAFGINPERAVRKMRATIARFAPKTDWIAYTLNRIQELWDVYNPASDLALQPAMRSSRSSEQTETQIKIDQEREFWLPIYWEAIDDITYLKLQCCSKPYPITPPKIHLQHNGILIETTITSEYNAEEGLLDVEIAQALNMQLRMAPNNRNTEMLLIDVVE